MTGVLGLCGLVAFAAGCRHSAVAATTEMPQAEFPPALTISAGDVLDLKFFYTPELNETQAVRPDGRISLQLVGEVDALGKTPAALADELETLYAPHLKRPEVTVIMRSLFNRRVYVGGEVKRPGAIDMPGSMTALEAIMEAGGFDMKTAHVRNVVVIRHRDGRRYGRALDFEDSLAGAEDRAFLLEPNDIVYVPRTSIAKVNQWIDQHINKLVPDFGFFYRMPAGEATIGLGLD